MFSARYIMMSVLRPFLLFGAILAGCSAAPSPPVIDSLDMPPTVAASPGGGWKVSGSLAFHDLDEPVHVLRVFVAATNTSSDTVLDLESGTISPLTLNFAATTPKGAQDYSITLIAQSGLEAVAQKTVTLE